MPSFSGLGNLSKTVMSKAAAGGDYLLSNSIARYSTMAAGSAMAAYGYANDRPVMGTLGLAAAGGVAFGSASRGYFGPRAQGYAKYATGVAKGLGSQAKSTVGTMSDRFRGMRSQFSRGPKDDWTMTGRPTSFGI